MSDDVEHIEIHGIDLAYRRAGTGPPLVLLHGALDDSRTWRRQLDTLSDEFTVLAWDAPGNGRSDDPPETFTANDYSDCLAEFIEATCTQTPHVLGMSWGSTLAIALWERRPDLVSSLVLASAYAGWAGSLPAEEVQRRRREILREIELPPERFVPGWIPTLLTASAPDEMVEEVSRIMYDFHRSGTRTAVKATAELDQSEALPTITVPTLLLYGDADVRSSLSVGRALHAAIPGATLRILPGAPHLANVESADLFNFEVRSFLHDPA